MGTEDEGVEVDLVDGLAVAHIFDEVGSIEEYPVL